MRRRSFSLRHFARYLRGIEFELIVIIIFVSSIFLIRYLVPHRLQCLDNDPSLCTDVL